MDEEDGGMFMLNKYKLLLAGLVLGICLCGLSLNVRATNRNDYLDSLNVGVSQIVDPTGKSANEEAIQELTVVSEANGGREETDLVMANVQVAMNVRAEADEGSDKVGLLYKDCGGRILERKDGWTRLRSGDLVGWASDEYLLFGEEAESLANDVGNLIVQIETDTLCVRGNPDEEAEAVGFIPRDEELEIIEVLDDKWISVDYEGEEGYVSAEYVDIDFHIDEGETMVAIQKREEEERKAKLTANRGAVVVGGDDTRLLAALIYCEAGIETYNGKLAVGAVVMNRVRSAAYPNTISGVIFASGQFTPALNGKVARVYGGDIPESCWEAARAAINGETNVGDATHFRRAGNHEGLLIDRQVFW
ncbi:MAG: cell wall hydrolase [Acetatifactor sp.]|nr:cell wall hydrolase [Acetatifactor sp.]